MRTIRKTVRGAAAGLVAALMLLVPTAALAAIIVSFDPPDTQVADGEIFDVVLRADISGGDAVVSFGVDVLFDAAILEARSVVVGAAFGNPIVDLGTDGVVDIAAFVLFPDPPASGLVTLATISFLAETVGMTTLTVDFPDFPVTDGFGLPFPPGGVVLPDAAGSAMVDVGVIPEPTAFVTFLVGLGVVGSTLRRSRLAG